MMGNQALLDVLDVDKMLYAGGVNVGNHLLND